MPKQPDIPYYIVNSPDDEGLKIVRYMWPGAELVWDKNQCVYYSGPPEKFDGNKNHDAVYVVGRAWIGRDSDGTRPWKVKIAKRVQVLKKRIQRERFER